MLIERPPQWLRRLAPEGVFRLPGCDERKVYLTFDDGPVPEATPFVLDTLDAFGAKAVFFHVADNARRYPGLAAKVRRRGHAVGNHTMHHLQGLRCPTEAYLADVAEADALLGSRMFRPPHGWMRRSQARAIARDYAVVMYDLVTRDYSRRLTAADVVSRVRRYARPGSIIVFHDSRKSIDRLRTALPESLRWLRDEGYTFGRLWDDLGLAGSSGWSRHQTYTHQDNE